MNPKNIRNIIIIFIFLVLAIYGYIYFFTHQYTPKVIINGKILYLEVAVSGESLQRGLSYRKSMPSDHGMVFVFDTKGTHPFWMHEMLFPLDFIWLNDTKVVDLTRNVPILTNNSWTPVLSSQTVNRIIETNVGTIDKYNIKIGDIVQFKN